MTIPRLPISSHIINSAFHVIPTRQPNLLTEIEFDYDTFKDQVITAVEQTAADLELDIEIIISDDN